MRLAAAVAALLLAGCAGGTGVTVGDDGPSKVGVGLPIDEAHQAASDAAPGVVLDARVEGSVFAYNLTATLRNTSRDTWIVQTRCDAAFLEGLRRDGAFLPMHGPDGCAEGERPLGPGQAEDWAGFWDATYWDAGEDVDDPDAGHQVEAPPGDYEWSVGVRVRPSTDAPESVTLRVPFAIRLVPE